MAANELPIEQAPRTDSGVDPAKPGTVLPGPSLGESRTGGRPNKAIPLRIRPEQSWAFEEAALKGFEDEMVVHSREFTPPLCEVLGEAQLRVALRRALRRAHGYGFTYRGPLRLFLEMIFLYGSDFDTDPQYPWAAMILRSREDQMTRAERLFSKVLDYQHKVLGPDGANTRQALENLLALARRPFECSAEHFVTEMMNQMTAVFPQKAAEVGEAGLSALIEEGSAVARKYRFPTVRGEALVVLLMFGFGHGCAEDPLYPWIAHTLKDDKITEPAARVDRLEKKAVTWLEHVLAETPKGAPA